MGSTGNATLCSVIYNLQKLIMLLINSLQTNDCSRSYLFGDEGPTSGFYVDAAWQPLCLWLWCLHCSTSKAQRGSASGADTQDLSSQELGQRLSQVEEKGRRMAGSAQGTLAAMKASLRWVVAFITTNTDFMPPLSLCPRFLVDPGRHGWHQIGGKVRM